MIIYKFLEANVGKIALSERLLGPVPNRFTMKFEMAWLGYLSICLEVEIKESKDVSGWLYSDIQLLYFSNNNQLYECSLSKLKELTEDKLKEKKFSERPEVNCMQRNEDGRIVAWIDVKDLLEISSKVVIKEKVDGI